MLHPALLFGDDSPNQLSLADLAAYRAALSGKATADDAKSTDSPRAVSFRDLWDKTDNFQGRRVEVRGRIERIFRQGAIGQFPALVQAWAFSGSNDPFCLVYPDSDEQPGLGDDCRFVGTFLKIVEYPASDGSRLVPMIVGPQSPKPAVKQSGASERKLKSGEHSKGAWRISDGLIGLVVALGVVGVLASRHLGFRAPAGRQRKAEYDPPLEFVDSEDPTRGIS